MKLFVEVENFLNLKNNWFVFATIKRLLTRNRTDIRIFLNLIIKFSVSLV